ncbi:hypothetical protein QKQ66_gp122 [Dione juno nucleopolyhedrovirus]|uniref:Uncharacterized protein n=1 Tax=Dione juno nucleopolyhedrovirus TaxID=2594175 RepID=A0AAE6H2Y5_9ABAC|nr:hypothetical protein QKQ66_gp122 [Dione juno nucleopolyhedrovirus]QDL57061.1 hypothetical protein DijuNPV-ORF-122 [Dione juno nucleopolyhedrovirus]
MYPKKVDGDNAKPLTQQLDRINEIKRKIIVESQHFEKIKRLTKDTSELSDLQRRVMNSRQHFLNFGVQNF